MPNWLDEFGDLFDGACVYHNNGGYYIVMPHWPIERCISLITDTGFHVTRIYVPRYAPIMELLK